MVTKSRRSAAGSLAVTSRCRSESRDVSAVAAQVRRRVDPDVVLQTLVGGVVAEEEAALIGGPVDAGVRRRGPEDRRHKSACGVAGARRIATMAVVGRGAAYFAVQEPAELTPDAGDHGRPVVRACLAGTGALRAGRDELAVAKGFHDPEASVSVRLHEKVPGEGARRPIGATRPRVC